MKADSDKGAWLRGLARWKGWAEFRRMGRGASSLPKNPTRVFKRKVVRTERANRKEARSKPMLDIATREK
jgi:hypothetical protein